MVEIELFTQVLNERGLKKFIINIFKETNEYIDNNTDIERWDKKTSLSSKPMVFLYELLKSFGLPFTIICEPFYSDAAYNDSYSIFYSHKHIPVNKYCRRLSFFTGKKNTIEGYIYDNYDEEKLNECFIGTCIVKPLTIGCIGETLINPSKLIDTDTTGKYIRTVNFKLCILGADLNVNAFPYMMQDQETTTCAEVTLLNLFQYFSERYSEYKIVYPSEIKEIEEDQHPQRVLPSHGLTYPIITKILSTFGFSPIMHDIDAYQTIIKEDADNRLKRLLYYYIESGIPVAIGLSLPFNEIKEGHSILCIGHGERSCEYRKRYREYHRSLTDSIFIADTADFYDDFVVMDDNQIPYMLKNYGNLSVDENKKVSILTIPLYNEMYMEAADAHCIVNDILKNEKIGISRSIEQFLNCIREDETKRGLFELLENLGQKKNPVVTRLFLSSSKNYRSHKVANRGQLNNDIKRLYSSVPLPRFIWICELYTYNSYDEKYAVGEIILDATSSPNAGLESLLILHYPGYIGFREPDASYTDLERYFNYPTPIENWDKFAGYSGHMTANNI